jgi:hypothetical protein
VKRSGQLLVEQRGRGPATPSITLERPRSLPVVGGWWSDLSDEQSSRLMRIGYGSRSLAFWSKVVRLQDMRLVEHLAQAEQMQLLEDAWTADLITEDELGPGIPPWEYWQTQVSIDAHMLVIAVRHVLAHGRHLAPMSPEAAALLADWARGPYAPVEMVRGVMEHYDSYWIKQRGTPKRGVKGDGPIVAVWPNEEATDFVLVLDEVRLPLLPMADAAFQLGIHIYELWYDRWSKVIVGPPWDLPPPGREP